MTGPVAAGTEVRAAAGPVLVAGCGQGLAAEGAKGESWPQPVPRSQRLRFGDAGKEGRNQYQCVRKQTGRETHMCTYACVSMRKHSVALSHRMKGAWHMLRLTASAG